MTQAAAPQQATTPAPPAERDRLMWLGIRRGLLVIVSAIETRYDLGRR